MGLKQTPLFAAHQKLGARLIEFGGWEMPVFYSSILDEHQTVRSAAGIFDISHMGEFLVSGPGAEPFLNSVLTNDLRKIGLNEAQYTLLCNETGGVIDDLYAYHVGEESFLLIVNASRIDADFAWLEKQWQRFPQRDDVKLANFSDDYAAVALQGPRSPDILDACFQNGWAASPEFTQFSQLKKNQISPVGFSIRDGDFGGFVARTGYTGEDGFEVIAPGEIMEFLWNKILNIGGPYGLKPAGLGARDTLRTEVCYPLYGHELDENTTPLEAGLGYFVALEKAEFVGRSALLEQKGHGIEKKCVAFKMSDKSAPPRPHYPIWSGGEKSSPIGEVTSGTQSPSLGLGIGLGYVPAEFGRVGHRIEIEIRGRRFPAEIVSKPIYKKT